MKHFIKFSLALCLIIACMLCVSAETVTGNVNTNISWSYDTESATLTISGSGELPTYGMVSIFAGEDFFDKVESVVIEEGITKINDYNFYFCQQLSSITLPESLTYIGTQAFAYVRNLERIHFPAAMVGMGNYPFLSCEGLAFFDVHEDNPVYSNDESGVLLNKDKTTLLIFPHNHVTQDYTVPRGVTTIADFAFYQCIWLTSLNFPDTVTTISDYAFINCYGLKSAKIPPSVTTIGTSVFGGATQVVVKGYSGSYIETYASNNRLSFSAISECADHVYSEWVTAKEPTVSTEGTKYRECINCFAYQSEIIPTITPEEPPLGDLDEDGIVTVADAMTLVKSIINDALLEGADMNGDGKVNLLDVIRILKSIIV